MFQNKPPKELSCQPVISKLSKTDFNISQGKTMRLKKNPNNILHTTLNQKLAKVQENSEKMAEYETPGFSFSTRQKLSL